MSSRKVTLPLDEAFNTSSLVTRQAARKLIQKINELDVPTIALDFTNINYASRSFFNELVHCINHVNSSKDKFIEIKNLNDDLLQIYDFVLKFKKDRSVIKKIDNTVAI